MGALDTTLKTPDEVRVDDTVPIEEMEAIMVDLATGEASDADAPEEDEGDKAIPFEANLAEHLDDETLDVRDIDVEQLSAGDRCWFVVGGSLRH